MKSARARIFVGAVVSILVTLPLTAVQAQAPVDQPATNQTSPEFQCKERPKDLAEPPKRSPAAPSDRRGKETPIDEGGVISAKPLCPEGQLPVPIERIAPKGNPFFSGTSVDAPYFYADAFASAGGKIPLFDGGGVVTRVENPAVATLKGTHSLFEIAVQGGVGNGDIVEIGWIKNVGEASPRLFVYHWIGGAQTCYNGCGWVQWNPSIVPGMTVTAGSQSYMGWVFFEGNWWGWYANQWVGYFPGGLWKGTYTKSSLVQWFGEAYEADPTPATDMGNGQRAAVAWAARFWYPCKVDAAAWVCWIDSNPALYEPNPPWYTILNVGGSSLRYGGPGGAPGVGVDP